MKKILPYLLLSFLLVGCNDAKTQPTTTQPTTTKKETTIISNNVNNNIYENKNYKFKFAIPSSSKLTGDQELKSTENFDPIHVVSLYSGGNINTTINTYKLAADREELKDIKNGANKYGYKKGQLSDGTEYWQAGPTTGKADGLFLTTVIYGKNYIYEIISSDQNRNKNFTSSHDQIVKSFKLE